MNKKSSDCSMWRRLSAVVTCAAGLFFQTPSSLGQIEQQPNDPWALHSLRMPHSLTLSGDGERIAFLVKAADVRKDRYASTLWVSETNWGQPRKLPVDSGVTDPEWSPREHALAFITQDSQGSFEIHIYRESEAAMRLVAHDGEITSIEWSPSGRKIAYTVRPETQVRENRESPAAGIPINKWNYSIYDAMSGKLRLERPSGRWGMPLSELWVVDVESGRRTQLAAEYAVSEPAWSPDETRIAFSAPDRSLESSSDTPFPLPPLTGLYITEIATDTTRRIAEQSHGSPATMALSAPSWSPDGQYIAYIAWEDKQRVSTGAQFTTETRVAIVDIDDSTIHEVENLPYLYWPRLYWRKRSELLIATTVEAIRGLYSIQLRESAHTPHRVLDRFGMISGVTTNADGSVVAFVQQSTSKAPEVVVAKLESGKELMRTNLNRHMDELDLPYAKRVDWRSDDGTVVTGMLYTPLQSSDRTGMLVVLVHGGPTVPAGESFVPYSFAYEADWHDRNGFVYWPFPVWEVVRDGATVLLPNYRGTASFGPGFDAPPSLWKEPLEDIRSGIEWATKALGIDADRVVIWGHSHGCSIAARMLTRYRRFAAALLAECAPGILSSYSLLPGRHNLLIQEPLRGGPPQTDIESYVRASPSYSTTGLTTPTLIQAGETASFVFSLDMLTGLWRAGTPHELIVYEDEFHNLIKPSSEADALMSARDWIRYWINGDREGVSNKYLQRWDLRKREMAWMRGNYPLVNERSPVE